MRAYRIAAIAVATIIWATPAKAGCWPSDNFPLVCWLDTYGLACEHHRALTSAKAVLWPEPRYSIYEFEIVDWWTSHPTVACPPTKTATVTGVWDRETGKAEESSPSAGSRYVYCNRNPWTGQGPSAPTLCSAPANDPNVGLPVTSAMLSQSQKQSLLLAQEPVHTRCQQMEPSSIGSQWLKGSSLVRVVAAHHEHQKIEWRLFFLDFYEFGPWHEATPPKSPAPTPTYTKYTERRIATTTRRFWLNKPGRWLVIPVAKPASTLAQTLSPAWHDDCPGAVFNID